MIHRFKPGIPATTSQRGSTVRLGRPFKNRFLVKKPALVIEPSRSVTRPVVTQSKEAALALNELRGKI